MRPFFGVAVGALLAFAAPSARAAVVYDNMFQASVPGWPTDTLSGIDGPVLAASFSTGSSGLLHALHLLLAPGGNSSGSNGAFMVWVAPDLGGTPDLNPLDALWNSGSISDTAFSNTGNGYWNLSFDPIAETVPLGGSTRYWVVMASEGSSPTSSMGWVWASTSDGTGVAGEGWYVECSGCYPTYPAGSETDSNETGPYVMSVDVTPTSPGATAAIDVTAAPEPMTLGILGLGFAGLGFVKYRSRARTSAQ